MFSLSVINNVHSAKMTCFPAITYLFQVSSRNTRKRCEICSKLTMKHQNDVKPHKMVKLTQAVHRLVKHTKRIRWLFSIVSVVDFEQVNVSWVVTMSK